MFDSIKDIINEAKMGRPFIMTDDENRENEGDIFVPAQFISEDIIKFMMLFARGLICVAIDYNIANKLNLRLHPRRNIDHHETAFTYSIDSKKGGSTGMSAADKVNTIKKLINEKSTIQDFKIPGHIFPILAKQNGVLERRGHTEAAVDIARLAKLRLGMVICEIINEDGTMAKSHDLIQFSKKHSMKISSVETLVQYIKKIQCS